MTNVEYTEFERLGMADSSIDEASTQSVFPANTNVLYVGLQVSARGQGRLPRATCGAEVPACYGTYTWPLCHSAFRCNTWPSCHLPLGRRWSVRCAAAWRQAPQTRCCRA